MHRITLFLLTLGLSLTPFFCSAAQPTPQPPAAEPPPLQVTPPAPPPPTKEPAIIAPATASEPQLKAGGNDATQLKVLQAERIQVLKRLVQISIAMYQVGTVDFNQLSSAQQELCDAQLNSTDEPEKRVALLTKQVEMANDVLKIVRARFNAGTVTEMDVCRAESLQLGLKIKLLQERKMLRPPTPAPKAQQP